jgi:two-component system sensor histidine kinase YesM
MGQITQGNLDIRLMTVKDGDELDMISGRFNEMCADLERYIEKSYVAEIEQKNAELIALQSQINPHFLYNTLEAIRMKAICNGDREVGKMLYGLAVIFRSQVKESNIIPLASELHYCKKYLELFEFRYQDKFTFSIDCETEYMEIPVIKFIVQPIVENYFIHGIRLKDNDNHLHIQVKKINNELWLTVSDNGKGMDEEEIEKRNRQFQAHSVEFHYSIGMGNVNRRIKAVYGNDYGVSLKKNEEGKGLCVCLHFPQEGCDGL